MLFVKNHALLPTPQGRQEELMLAAAAVSGEMKIEKEGDALMRRIPFGQVEKLSVSIGSLSLLYHFLSGGDVDLHAAVLCASGGGFVGCDRVVPTFA